MVVIVDGSNVVVEVRSFVDCNSALAVLIAAVAVGEKAAQNQLSLYLPHGVVVAVRILATGSVKSCSCCLYRPIPHCYQRLHTFPVRCGAAPGGDPFPLAPSWNCASSG